MLLRHLGRRKLSELLDTQRSVIEHQKKEKVSRRLYGIAVVVDDWADSPQIMSSRRAGGNALNTLLVRGRHSMISTFILSQKLRAMGSLLRVNAQSLVIFRIRNGAELRDSILEELSAIYDKKVILEMYKLATAEPYSFFFVNLAAQRVRDMFWKNFEYRLVPTDAPS